MLDFLFIATRSTKRGVVEIYPKFMAIPSSDLMIRGRDFYAIWDQEKRLWRTKESDAIRLIDNELRQATEEYKKTAGDTQVHTLYMWDTDSGVIDKWHKYCQKQMRDNFHPLDEKLIFSDTATRKDDYVSKKLNYPLKAGDMPAYEDLMSTLYSAEERKKIEWAIGSIINGDSKYIQKFLVFYGAGGTGKSTVLHIIEQLFEGYTCTFKSKALTSLNNTFALEPFKKNPLVAIEHDGDLSKIADNSVLNSLVSHEVMSVNEKFKATYENHFNCFIFMGTNKPVKITDAKSGLIRRLIDVSPTGNKIPMKRYQKDVKDIKYELGAIAWHCKQVYESDPNAYDDYIPIRMLGASNDFYNFIMDSYEVFKKEDGVSLKAAYAMYDEYCSESKVMYPYSKRAFKEELKNYFENFDERHTMPDGLRAYNYYSGFRFQIGKFVIKEGEKTDKYEDDILELTQTVSLFDREFASCKAQYEQDDPVYPLKSKWANCRQRLERLDTSKTHYVLVPDCLVVSDFDLRDESGEKSLKRNLQAASKWPKTYAELSKSGAGVHLHYYYSGDPELLYSGEIEPGIEQKVFGGKKSLRRRLTKCNDIPILTLDSGLKLVEKKGDASDMVDSKTIKNEKGLRRLVERSLNKEVWDNTKPNIDFIAKVLDEADKQGLKYDLSDYYDDIVDFAANASNQSEYCLAKVAQMKFKSNEPSDDKLLYSNPIVFFDCEVFPNLLLVNWKIAGEDRAIVRWINPKPHQIELLIKYRLIGFNNRKYDNHILWACMMGYDNKMLYSLSSDLVHGKFKGFGEAYNLSYTDVYDFCSKKQSLKKWEIELGKHHQELGYPWDQPVPEDKWTEVAEYCDNDVLATEAVFNANIGDFEAREMLAAVTGMTVNSTTNSLTTRLIFGTEKHPPLVYTDLSLEFPGYEFLQDEKGKWHNIYRDTDLGFGGWVYSKPGIYYNVALLDVASLHPHSIIAMNTFGERTAIFKELVDARIAIKHGDYDTAGKLFGGKFKPYLKDKKQAKSLAQALKIAINSVYGLTSAKFDNPFRDKRNKNNIVALRGALFMKTLLDEVTARGYEVVHIKTDSIKIANADSTIIDFCMDFAKKYKYTFEHEATYDKICLVDKANYVAHGAPNSPENANEWTSTGERFSVPYVFKKLFSHEDVIFSDLCETKAVQTAIYIRRGEKEPQFIGRVGRFTPITPGKGGGTLLRQNGEKFDSVNGTKGYEWAESEEVERRPDLMNNIDMRYFEKILQDAIDAISKYGNVEEFVA